MVGTGQTGILHDLMSYRAPAETAFKMVFDFVGPASAPKRACSQ